MRILCVAGRYWPARGGAETLLRHVAHELARSHEVTVLAYRVDEEANSRLYESLDPPPAFEPFEDEGVLTRQVRLSRARQLRLLPMALTTTPVLARWAYGRARIPLASLYGAVAGRALAAEARRADVVHAWSTDFVGAGALAAARRAGRPLVLTPFVHRGQWGHDPASLRLHRRVDRLIALLEVERGAFLQDGVAAERIAVCGTCSPGVTAGHGRALRERLGIRGPLVVFLGARRGYKGHDVLLAAVPHLLRRHPNATVAFVGPGDAVAGEGILDAGAIEEGEKGAWLEAADVFCLPSAHEIYPVSLLEAWSVGTPALLSDIPPLVELIRRSGGGRTVARDPVAVAEALAELLANDDGRGAMGEAGRAFWRAHGTPRSVVECLEGVYEEVTHGRP